jgi:hypothetical protein
MIPGAKANVPQVCTEKTVELLHLSVLQFKEQQGLLVDGGTRSEMKLGSP